MLIIILFLGHILKNLYKTPLYKTIDDIPLEIFKSKCAIFINWSHPLNEIDIESIIKLDPIYIITITETGIYRGAGSPKFHYFLSRCGIHTTGHYTDDSIESVNKIIDGNAIFEFDFSAYNLISSTFTSFFKIGYEYPLNFEIILLSKEKFISELPCTIDNSEESKITHLFCKQTRKSYDSSNLWNYSRAEQILGRAKRYSSNTKYYELDGENISYKESNLSPGLDYGIQLQKNSDINKLNGYSGQIISDIDLRRYILTDMKSHLSESNSSKLEKTPRLLDLKIGKFLKYEGHHTYSFKTLDYEFLNLLDQC